MGHQRRGEQVVQAGRAGPDAQHTEGDGDGDDGADEPVAQFDQVRNEGSFSAGEFVGLVAAAHRPPGRPLGRPGGLNLATRAAPDKALVRMPARCLYHCGVAPRLRRQFFFGCW